MPAQLLVELYSPSLELILLVIASVANLLLAYAVYSGNPRSATNSIFALLSIATVCWLTTNYLTGHIPPRSSYADLALVVHRFGILFAAPMSALLFLLAHTLPSETVRLSKGWFYTVVASTVGMMALNVSPYAFTGISIDIAGNTSPVGGPGLLPFSVLSTIFSVLAVYWLVYKYRHSEGVEHEQFRFVLAGMLIMLTLIIGTVLVPLVVLNVSAFLPFTSVYTLVFLGMTAYAITKYQLFDIKVLLTEAVTIVIGIVLFAKIFGEQTFNAQLIDALVLAFMAVFGYFLIGSVRREVEQRQLIERQEKELEAVNARQENLLHFISHEVKGYLAKGEAAFAEIAEDTVHGVPAPVQTLARGALSEMRKGVATVMDILDASNLKKGTVTFKNDRLDFRKVVEKEIEQLRASAYEKRLGLDVKIADGAYAMQGDEEKLREHVVRNLVDNAIKYTPAGTVHVELSDGGGKIRFMVQDSGVGITPEDMARLFTEGGHGKDSMKVNVHSTGYGLFIAKQIVSAHGGKIWAESAGAGQGSRFIVEFTV
jgi:signal transduction histidine kinase